VWVQQEPEPEQALQEQVRPGPEQAQRELGPGPVRQVPVLQEQQVLVPQVRAPQSVPQRSVSCRPLHGLRDDAFSSYHTLLSAALRPAQELELVQRVLEQALQVPVSVLREQVQLEPVPALPVQERAPPERG
jgi:hypothetical protein